MFHCIIIVTNNVADSSIIRWNIGRCRMGQEYCRGGNLCAPYRPLNQANVLTSSFHHSGWKARKGLYNSLKVIKTKKDF